MASTSKPKPHFLTLAGELRNQIIRFAVVREAPIAVVASCASSRGREDVRAVSPGSPALAGSCQQLREEVNAIHFEENDFTFLKSAHNKKAMWAFERMAGPSVNKINCTNVISRRGGDVTLELVRDAISGLSFMKYCDTRGVELSSVQICVGAQTSGGSTVPGRPPKLSPLEVYLRFLIKDGEFMTEVNKKCHECGGRYWHDFGRPVLSFLSFDHFQTSGHRANGLERKKGMGYEDWT